MSRAEPKRRAGLPALAMLSLLVLLLGAGTAMPQSRELLQRLPPDLREHLRERKAQWAGWSAQERSAFTGRVDEWEQRDPEARARERELYAAWRALDSIDRQLVQAARARHAALPSTAQAQLREKFEALDEHVRRGWLLGPRLGADYPALQPLLAQVPEDQREPLLQVLREMTPPQRADLAVLLQRTPAEERDALRRGLLSTSETNRGAWLRLRLER
jgi:hypothetical protein